MFTNFVYGENNVTAAVLKIEAKQTKTGKTFSSVVLADGNGTIEAKAWASPEMLKFAEKDVVSAVIEKQEYNGAPSYILKFATKTVESFASYLPHAPIDVKEYCDLLLNTCEDFADKNLKMLVRKMLGESIDIFIYHPAAKAVHHNYTSGLLYHTGRMLMMAKQIGSVYNGIDLDILYAGAILHDFGKLEEMRSDELGNVSYTAEGNLFGHALICIEKINYYCGLLGIDSNCEKIKHLKHLIAAHHGELEYGAIVKPATKEAMLLNKIDEIDARIWQFETAEEGLECGSVSDKIFGLGTVVYKPDRS